MISFKFKSAYDYGEMLAEPEFNHVYTWRYIDKQGNIREDSINQLKVIESVDYLTPTEIVGKGGIPDNGNGLYGDFTTLPSDIGGINAFMGKLQADLAAFQAKNNGTASAESAEKDVKVTDTNTKNNEQGVKNV